MRKTFFILILQILCVSITSAQSPLVKSLTDNMNALSLQEKVNTKDMIREFITISDHGRYNDVMVLELYLAVNISDEAVDKYMSSMNPDGSWPDINYKDKGRSQWAPSYHPTRIQSLVKVYKTPTSRHYMSEKLSKTIHKAMDYWFKAGLVCPNWWYNEIGVPRLMGPAFILIKDELSPQELNEAIKVMANSTLRQTGQNKIWQAGNVLIRGMLQNDEALIKQSRDSIVSEIYMSTAEGLQPDFSFHQHGPQLQFGNYGLAYAGTTTYWARVFSGTPLAISTKQTEYMKGYVLDGLQWTVWRGYMDPSACGRQFFRNAMRGKSHSLAVTAVNMTKVDPENAKSYIDYVYRNQLNPDTPNNVNGYKYFWRSDYGVFRAPTWMASVRMNSDRTLGFEMTNSENLKGKYTADGVMSVMVDGDEYHNIFPLWDWKRLPGLTAIYDTMPIPFGQPRKPENKSAFVGGVSDGANGVAALDLVYDSISARKAYFFLKDVVVCLGSGISTVETKGTQSQHRVLTTLNQEWSKGDVKYSHDLVARTLDTDKMSEKWLSWVYHNKKGYCLIDKARLNISKEKRTGSWHDIAKFYPEDNIDNGEIFTISIDHGNNPKGASYAYCVLPDRTPAQTAEFAKDPAIFVEHNTPECQAVSSTDMNITEAVFYAPATVKFKSLEGRLSVKTPGIIMIKKIDGAQYSVSVSDPTQKLAAFSFEIDGDFVGYGARYNHKTGKTTVTVNLPIFNGHMGESKTVILTKLDHKDNWR